MAAKPNATAITVRGLDPALHRALKRRAIKAGRSLEAEVRRILGAAISTDADKAGTLAKRLCLDIFGAPLEFDIWPELPGDSTMPDPFAAKPRRHSA